jgi:type I restriction-modification system DNA methylase subunit
MTDAARKEITEAGVIHQFLDPLLEAYCNFGTEPGFARAASVDEIAAQGYSLSIPLCVKRVGNGADGGDDRSLPELWAAWQQEGRLFWQEMDALVEMLDELSSSKDYRCEYPHAIASRRAKVKTQ